MKRTKLTKREIINLKRITEWQAAGVSPKENLVKLAGIWQERKHLIARKYGIKEPAKEESDK